MKVKHVFLVFASLCFFGIQTTKGQTNKSEIITELIKKKKKFNEANGFGFRIQLANGNEIEVKKTKELFQIEYPTIKTYILFESPEWKVQVGDFKTRIEADKALNEIAKKFKGVIVVPR